MCANSSESGGGAVDVHAPCRIPNVPFRGANCSDAEGVQVGFDSILALLDSAPDATLGGRQWDVDSSTPFYTYINATTGATHQRWYDDAQSSALKYAIALANKLRGVGPFTFSDLGYDTPDAAAHAAAMWDALRAYKAKA